MTERHAPRPAAADEGTASSECVRRTAAQRGAALLLALILLIVLFALAAALHAATEAQHGLVRATSTNDTAFRAADIGLGKGRLALLNEVATVGVTRFAAAVDAPLLSGDGAVVTVTDRGGRTFELTSAGTFAGRTRRLKLVLGFRTRPLPNAPALGAIVADGDIKLNGGLTVSGNDHYADGTRRFDGADKPATVLTGRVRTEGGNGSAAAAGMGHDYQPIAAALDGVKDDQTTVWDPEQGEAGDEDRDQLDNDIDGYVDEDGFPDRPAGFLGMTNEAGLKQAAYASGTYFTSVADYHAWLKGNEAYSGQGQGDASGKIIYLDLEPGLHHGELKLPHNPPPAEPSLFVVSGRPRNETFPPTSTSPPTNDVTVGPVHVWNGSGDGTFQGLFMAETIEHMNGGGQLVGAVVSFNARNRTQFGNGNFDIRYSSDVIGRLPGTELDLRRPRDLVWWEERELAGGTLLGAGGGATTAPSGGGVIGGGGSSGGTSGSGKGGKGKR